jgi:thiosulfate/3-mercaptopyruvate sulfurtransferase
VSAWNLPLADLEVVDKARSTNGCVIIDVREGYRYRGEREPIDQIAGHIPGAINVPYTGNLQPDGRFLAATDLRKKYETLIGKRNDVIVHCGSGVTACHTLLAMASAGIEGARLYVGSWSEWSRNAKPMATGTNP